MEILKQILVQFIELITKVEYIIYIMKCLSKISKTCHFLTLFFHNDLYILLEYTGSDRATTVVLASECSQQEMFDVVTLHGEFTTF